MIVTTTMVAPTPRLIQLSQSTEEKEPVSTTKSLSSTSTPTVCGRSVSFDLNKNTTHFIPEETDIHPEEKWFTTEDHKNMKARSRSDAREWRRHGYHILLDNSYECPPIDVHDYLSVFVQLPDKLSRRGLERQCSRKHGEERSDLKDLAKKTVFLTQEHLKRQGLDEHDRAQKLSVCYSYACRSAVAFARNIAKADEREVVRLSKLETMAGDSYYYYEPEESELVKRIFSRHGLVSPADSKNNHNTGSLRMQRRLSNCSAATENSLDSQRQWGHRTLIPEVAGKSIISVPVPNSAKNSLSGGSHHRHHHSNDKTVRRSSLNFNCGRSGSVTSVVSRNRMGEECYAAIA